MYVGFDAKSVIGINVPEPKVLHVPVVDAPEIFPANGISMSDEQTVTSPPAFTIDSETNVRINVSLALGQAEFPAA